MSRSAQTQISLTKNIPSPNIYIRSLYREYKDWVFDEVKAPSMKGKWKTDVFQNKYQLLHLEIGPGNGRHFARQCCQNPKEGFLAIEIKYKPLIQSIRRVRKNKSENGRLIRYNARFLTDLFEKQELNNVYIHFPDPWLKKKKQKKHQLITSDFCKNLYEIQKSKSLLELKTDSENYFHQSIPLFLDAGYQVKKQSLNLYKDKDFKNQSMDSLSQFELLFVQKSLPVKYALFEKR